MNVRRRTSNNTQIHIQAMELKIQVKITTKLVVDHSAYFRVPTFLLGLDKPPFFFNRRLSSFSLSSLRFCTCFSRRRTTSNTQSRSTSNFCPFSYNDCSCSGDSKPVWVRSPVRHSRICRMASGTSTFEQYCNKAPSVCFMKLQISFFYLHLNERTQRFERYENPLGNIHFVLFFFNWCQVRPISFCIIMN